MFLESKKCSAKSELQRTLTNCEITCMNLSFHDEWHIQFLISFCSRSNIGRTRQLVKDTNQGVKLLGQLCDTPNATEKTVVKAQRTVLTSSQRRKKIQAKLTKDFQTWLGRFQEVTKQSARKEREVAVPAPSSSTAYASLIDSSSPMYGICNQSLTCSTAKLGSTGMILTSQSRHPY